MCGTQYLTGLQACRLRFPSGHNPNVNWGELPPPTKKIHTPIRRLLPIVFRFLNHRFERIEQLRQNERLENHPIRSR